MLLAATQRLVYALGLFIGATLLLLGTGCKRNTPGPPTEGAIRFSVDTLSLDTLLVDKRMPIVVFSLYNTGRDAVIIAGMDLEKGTASPFSVLVDGRPLGQDITHRLEGGDSLVLLAQLKPLEGQDTRRIEAVTDHLVVPLAQGALYLPLRAWRIGWEALPKVIEADLAIPAGEVRVAWDSVEVKQGVTLRVAEGARILFAPGASLEVKGSLIVEATPEKRALFSPIRTQFYYTQQPGQWAGVTLRSKSGPHTIQALDIQGAINALAVDTIVDPVLIEQVRLLHSSLTGLWIRGSQVTLRHSIISQAYRNAIRVRDGSAQLIHTTIYGANAPPHTRRGPLLLLEEGGTMPRLTLVSCILRGDREAEVEACTGAILEADYSFLELPDPVRKLFARLDNCNDQDPLLERAFEGECSLQRDSPARGTAPVVTPAPTTDLFGNPWPATPSPGANQKEPEQQVGNL